MDQLEPKAGGFGWRLGAAAWVPFAVASVYLLLSRWPSHRFTTFSDYVAFAVSILAGAAFIATLPIRGSFRAFCLLLYIPLFAVLVVFFSLWFLAIVFHDGL